MPSPLIQPFPKSIIFIPPIILFLFLFPIPTPNIPLSLQPIIPKTPQKPPIQPKPPLTPSVLTPNLPLLSTPPPSPTPYIISLLPPYQISIPNYLTIL
ncbi:anaerobic C4-dicarboxylate transporter family protein, partial [Staphylococcus epidermidis]|uniref:anaerobic C4-dicarboxylate transporter family protein n=1 Tax=Staphylococcus epidermidis TaxID=1282 RepID=UPI0037D99356